MLTHGSNVDADASSLAYVTPAIDYLLKSLRRREYFKSFCVALCNNIDDRYNVRTQCQNLYLTRLEKFARMKYGSSDALST